MLYPCTGRKTANQNKLVLYDHGATDYIWTPVVDGAGSPFARDAGEYLEIDSGTSIGNPSAAKIYTPVEITSDMLFIAFNVCFFKYAYSGGSYSANCCVFCSKRVPIADSYTADNRLCSIKPNGYYVSNNMGGTGLPKTGSSLYNQSPVYSINVEQLTGLHYVGFGIPNNVMRVNIRVDKIEIFYK